MLPTLLFYLLLGAFAGVMAGLLGVGGGLIIVPALAWIFQHQQIAETALMHLAIGTSLATIIVTSISSVRAHHQRGAVLWATVWRLTPGIIIGAWLGAAVADALSSFALQKVFAVFVLLMSVQMAFGAKPAPHRDLPETTGMLAAGGVIGVVSAIVGIGGGSLTVPFLSWCNVPIRQAVATSAACGLPIALAGALGFVVTGLNAPDLPAWSLGYVYGPALLGVAVTSMLFAPLGAKLAHTLPTEMLKKIFAVFLAVVGVKMLLG
ncbi:MAG: sulfite exporter TauE/SafE family protein [Candidatus Competibacteraceae bacterium]|nr:sulfite exporter TauE/SafE family protein [Candidatus Competibacteraceae bacterium]MBK7983330.1 sulfite exporter TauE/SafE family protein [Candidatus Competibacteraceae bacterium]MBK8898124.1 sulfite exporter TauE/SafE family protein [Candidatus Competibacteraceae bacterium]MBK8961930.1 sulfite exporter TauE/SafE family protein [Candidatus Competibacteraceae bacterium]MBK9951147.1 sulfite exporter TauE/SafE family protein [Candidatus Competibacteraceae bacterium]